MFLYFKEIVNTHLLFNLDLIWNDTIVENVFMNRNAALEITRYMMEELSLSNKEGEDLDAKPPAIYGWLLGKYYQTPQGRYHISIELFVKSEHEHNTGYQVAIEDKGWEAYNHALEKYPEFAPLGWFHTHPGHGLFLSRNDEMVRSQFPEPYQVAMEIDDKSRNLDVAFFTRNSKKDMNNENNRKVDQWFSWIDVQDWIRKTYRARK